MANVETDLLSVNDFAKKYPTFTKGTLRAYIFNADSNGFREVIRRIGARVYIKENAFFNWVDRLNGFDAIGEGV
jgi:hypothetical protein